MKQEIIVFQEDNKINKPNILINIVMSNVLTLKEKKVYNVLLRKLLNQNINDFQTNKIKTTITDISRELNTTERGDIKDILTTLEDTKIQFDHLIDKKEYTTTTRLITEKSVYKKNSDSCIIYFSENLTNEIMKYWEEYTKLDLDQMNKLKRGHSLTLYELFKSTIGKHPQQKKNYTEKELRGKLGLLNNYEDISIFNRNVIKGSLKEINEKTSLNVELLQMVKPTKKNPDIERTYKFYITQEKEFNYYVWLDTLKYYAIEKKYNFNFEKTDNYTIYMNKDLDDKFPQPLLIKEYNNGTPYRTLTLPESEKIYKKKFEIFKKNPKGFIELIKIDYEDFLVEYEEIREVRKHSREWKNILKNKGDNNE